MLHLYTNIQQGERNIMKDDNFFDKILRIQNFVPHFNRVTVFIVYIIPYLNLQSVFFRRDYKRDLAVSVFVEAWNTFYIDNGEEEALSFIMNAKLHSQSETYFCASIDVNELMDF